MGLQIFTGKIGRYKGTGGCDITVKTTNPFGKIIAPTWSIVNPIIQARRAKAETQVMRDTYNNLYQEVLSRAETEHAAIIEHILKQQFIVLLCYCNRYEFCHRNIVAEWLVSKGATHRGWLE